MHAQLRSLSVKVGPLSEFTPADPTYFGALLDATIGPAGGLGEEIFQATVCSPRWLADNVLAGPNKGFAFVRHHLVIDHWDAAHVEKLIVDLCGRVSGPTWSDVANKLSRYLAWEFEDYAPT